MDATGIELEKMKSSVRPEAEPIEMPRFAGKKAQPELVSALRRFHFAAEGGGVDAGRYRPLTSPRALDGVPRGYPLVISRRSESGEALAPDIEQLLAAMDGEDAEAAAALRDSLRDRARRSDRLEPFDAVLADIRKGGDRAGNAGRVIGRLLKALPKDSLMLGFGPETAQQVLRHAAEARYEPASAAFADERRHQAFVLRAVIDAGRDRKLDRDPDSIRASIGTVGSKFLDVDALADVAGGTGSSDLDPDRADLLEAAAKRLEDDAAGLKSVVVLPPGGDAPSFEDCGWDIEFDEDPCAAAARLFDQRAAAVAVLVRDLRLAKLESEGRYDPEHHDPWLNTLNWTFFSRKELDAIPPVVALVSEREIEGTPLTSLSQLLSSGRPVQILAGVDPFRRAESDTGPLLDCRFEPGYLGVSHRKAFVLQATPGYPLMLQRGMNRGARAAQPALYVVPAFGDTIEALTPEPVYARAHALFEYDPERGATWSRRLDISANPAIEAEWSQAEITLRAAGREEVRSLGWTFADLALLDPAHAPDFLELPDDTDSADWVSVIKYLALDDETALTKIPFVHAIDGTGKVTRLALTARLVAACRDRLDVWRTLQELGGVHNAYAVEAEDRVRRALMAEAAEARSKEAAAHRAELEQVRGDAMEAVVRRLVALLLDPSFDELPAAQGQPGPGLGGLLTGSADQVAASLFALIGEQDLETDSPASSPAAGDLAARLLNLVDPETESGRN